MDASADVVDIALPEWAAPIREASHRYKVLYGGRGAGRSWSIARSLLIQAAERKLRILCCREIQASIKASVHTLLKEQVELMGLEAYYDVLETEIRSTLGSVFFFEGLHRNIGKVKSYEDIDICWVEEGEHVSERSWEILIPTVRKPGSQIIVNFNPDQETDPTYRRFVVSPPPDAWIQFVTSEHNDWLPNELKAERDYLYRVDPDAAAHVWGGGCRTATDFQILKGKWIVQDFTPGEDWDGPYHGADFGFAQDPATLVRCWVHDRRLYVEYEAYRVGLDLDDTPDQWRRNVPGSDRYVVRADPSRPESISHLRRHGFPRIEKAPSWKGSVEDGIAHLRQYEQIVIHPRCRHTIDEARHYSYKVDPRTGDVLPAIVDAMNHCIDAIRYALGPLIQGRRVLRVGGAAAG